MRGVFLSALRLMFVFHILYLVSYDFLEVFYMKGPILVLTEYHPTALALQIQTIHPVVSAWLAKKFYK